jgi:hypothetical protein
VSANAYTVIYIYSYTNAGNVSMQVVTVMR